MSDQDRIILDHYKRVAELFGHAPTSTMKDQHIRSVEVEFFCSEIEEKYQENPNLKILDIGCGNGYLLSVIHERFPEAELHGVEFTPELYELAKSRGIKGSFINGDCRRPDFFKEQMDVIITERVIINLLEDEEKTQALKNIALLLNDGGQYLMSESFGEPFINLNKAREQNLLDTIPVPEKNDYLFEDDLEVLYEHGLKEGDVKIGKNHLSTWFFTSRVLHHLIKPEGARKEGTELVKFLIEGIGPGVGNYSPILFRKFIR